MPVDAAALALVAVLCDGDGDSDSEVTSKTPQRLGGHRLSERMVGSSPYLFAQNWACLLLTT
jgi:hypothetical protein